jgi:hypothetical protein
MKVIANHRLKWRKIFGHKMIQLILGRGIVNWVYKRPECGSYIQFRIGTFSDGRLQIQKRNPSIDAMDQGLNYK